MYIKKIFFVAAFLLIGVGGGYSVSAASIAHYWSFDGYQASSPGNPTDAPDKLGDNLPHDPGGIWTLEKKKNGIYSSYAKNVMWNAGDMVNPDYSNFGYGAKYGNFYHIGAPSPGQGGEYLTCKGTELNFSQAWSYSITSWIKPEVTGQMALFSIGNAGEGFRLVFDSASNSLKFSMHGSNSDFGSVTLTEKFAGDSTFQHIGFSIANDGHGNMSVNYYVNGLLIEGKSGDVSTLLNQSINGFNIGADGKDGELLGSCHYDDIKVFTGVLDKDEIMEAMKPGTGNFEIDNPSVPEPSTVLLFGLGGSLCLLRRRRVA